MEYIQPFFAVVVVIDVGSSKQCLPSGFFFSGVVKISFRV